MYILKKITALRFPVKSVLILLFISISLTLEAQERSAFRSGYMRLGINQLGKDLQQQLSPKQNVFDGNYGAGSGFVFETGRVFYFMKRDHRELVNFGLDWTYLSLNYNKMNKWDSYGKAAAGSPDYNIDGTKIAAAISGKLGPVISLNPLEKLVIDFRAQIAPTFRFFDLTYTEDSESSAPRYFSFINYGGDDVDENYDGEAVKNRIAFGFQKSFGVTIRRKAIGLSIDYVSGNVKSNYEAEDNTGSSNGKVNIPVSNLQFKLNFTL